MNEKEKKNKNADETLRIIKKILDYNKNAQRSFSAASHAAEKVKLGNYCILCTDQKKLRDNSMQTKSVKMKLKFLFH